MKRISVALVPVLLSAALVLPTGSAQAAPTQAPATGCAADADLHDRQLVKKAAVRTESGRTFGVIRFFAGTRYEEPRNVSAGGYEPRFCLDLVVANAFRGRHPKFHADVSSVSAGGGANGRAHTGRFDGGQQFSTAGEKIRVTFRTFGLEAYGSMRLTFPDLG